MEKFNSIGLIHIKFCRQFQYLVQVSIQYSSVINKSLFTHTPEIFDSLKYLDLSVKQIWSIHFYFNAFLDGKYHYLSTVFEDLLYTWNRILKSQNFYSEKRTMIIL